MKKVLITGGAGFIGHHLIAYILNTTDWQVTTLDRKNVGGKHNRFAFINGWENQKHRVRFVTHDLRSPINDTVKKEIGEVDDILHLAANSHVARSIADPLGFAADNVVGTVNVLNFARGLEALRKFNYFSTEGVYGPAPPGIEFKESDAHWPTNPYAATKSGAESMCIAFANTYQMPVFITHVMNVFGERQHPEKFIPMTIRKVRNHEVVRANPGSRSYIHARNVAAAILLLLERGEVVNGRHSGIYNIVGEREMSNLDLAKMIAEFAGQPLKYEIPPDTGTRADDSRYALDGSRMNALGWKLPVSFEQSLAQVVQWTLAHPEWL